jgi:hypothetical protein
LLGGKKYLSTKKSVYKMANAYKKRWEEKADKGRLGGK